MTRCFEVRADKVDTTQWLLQAQDMMSWDPVTQEGRTEEEVLTSLAEEASVALEALAEQVDGHRIHSVDLGMETSSNAVNFYQVDGNEVCIY